MEHTLQEPVRTFNIVPGVVLNLLARTSKFSDVRYFTIFNKEEVNIYNASTITATTP